MFPTSLSQNSEEQQVWVDEETLEGHADWVRDVAWAPNIGLPRSYIATASQVSIVLFNERRFITVFVLGQDRYYLD